MERLIIEYGKNGVTIIPKHRIIIYEKLLDSLENRKVMSCSGFMCNIIESHSDFYCRGININTTLEMSSLPELAKYKPNYNPSGKILSYSDAWYESREFDLRIQHVKDAIKDWHKEFDNNL